MALERPWAEWTNYWRADAKSNLVDALGSLFKQLETWQIWMETTSDARTQELTPFCNDPSQSLLSSFHH
jgi:hypothetical protein